MTKTTKAIIWIVVAIIVIAGIWYGISKKPQAPVSKETIKIGILLPLTGDLAEYGNDQLNAINLFLKEYNLSNRIKLLIEDSQSDPKTAVSALNKILAYKPDLILTLGSSISLAIQPITNSLQIPVITSAANSATANGYMIQNLPTDSDYVGVINKDLKNKNIKKLGIIYRNDDLGLSVSRSLDFQGKKYEEAVNPEEKDFRTAITKIKSFNPDAVFLIHTGKSLGLLIRQVRTLLGDIKIYSTLEVNYPEVKETAGETYYNISYSDLNLDYNKPMLKDFKDKYIAEYKKDPSLDSVLAYNAMSLINECITGKLESLNNCLQNANFQGLVGNLKVEGNRVLYGESIGLKEVLK